MQQSKTLSRLELDLINLRQCALSDLREALQQVPNVSELSLRACDMSPEQLLQFLGVFNAASNSGLKLLDVRDNKELINLPQNKKYGAQVQKALEKTYVKLDFDKKAK